MKRNLIALLLLSVIMLSGCSGGVSQSDYDQIVAEKESIQKEYDDLQEEYEKCEANYMDMLNEKTEKLTADLPNQYAQAWVDVSFSGSGVCATYEDTLFVSVLTGKEVKEENVKEMRSELLSSITTYAYMSKATPDSFPWKYLSVTFYDASGAGIFQFTIGTDESATLKSVLLNTIYPDDLENLAKWLQ